MQIPSRPQSQLEIEEASEAPATNDESSIVYPTGRKLWLTIASLMLTCVTYGVDLPIVAAAIPSLTDHFESIRDIGWYSAAYGLVGSAVTFFWARSYTIFPVKYVYVTSIIVFEVGALVATVAPTSSLFIVGRALSGCGGSGMGSGLVIVLTHLFPSDKRPMWVGILTMTQIGTMATAPLIGGALIDAFNWRACFGINLPLGTLALALVWFGSNSPVTNPHESLPLKEKLVKLDPLSTLVFVPSITCLLLALQWVA
ncbi:hypothetical protein LTR70_010790 [Exophiala xenobiotica]|nr:hypothetical protein LTR70_010790 [Exophiala xenobiotica]